MTRSGGPNDREGSVGRPGASNVHRNSLAIRAALLVLLAWVAVDGLAVDHRGGRQVSVMMLLEVQIDVRLAGQRPAAAGLLVAAGAAQQAAQLARLGVAGGLDGRQGLVAQVGLLRVLLGVAQGGGARGLLRKGKAEALPEHLVAPADAGAGLHELHELLAD